MKLNRFLSLALISALSLSLLVGCSSADPEITVPTLGTEVTTPETEDVETDTPDTTPEVDIDAELTLPDMDDSMQVEPNGDMTVSGDITMSRSDFTLFSVGDSYQLTLSNLIATDTVTFATTDETVATVFEDGTVTAVGAGTATITATILLDGITAVDRTAIVRCDIEIPVVEEPQVVTPTVAEFFAQLQTDYVSTGSLMQLEGDMLAGAYPGLADIDTLQCMVYAPMMSFSAMELALVEVANSDDIDAVKAVFQARIDAQVAGGAWYPAAIEGWEKNSHIVTSGNYVFLVVTSGYQDGVDAPIIETADDFIAAFEAAF